MRLSILTCTAQVTRCQRGATSWWSCRQGRATRRNKLTHQLASVLRLLPRWLLRKLRGEGVEQSPGGAAQLVTRQGAHLERGVSNNNRVARARQRRTAARVLAVDRCADWRVAATPASAGAGDTARGARRRVTSGVTHAVSTVPAAKPAAKLFSGGGRCIVVVKTLSHHARNVRGAPF